MPWKQDARKQANKRAKAKLISCSNWLDRQSLKMKMRSTTSSLADLRRFPDKTRASMRTVSFQGEEKGRSINSVARQQLATSVEPEHPAKEAVVDDSQVKCSENGAAAEGAGTETDRWFGFTLNCYCRLNHAEKRQRKRQGKRRQREEGKEKVSSFRSGQEENNILTTI